MPLSLEIVKAQSSPLLEKLIELEDFANNLKAQVSPQSQDYIFIELIRFYIEKYRDSVVTQTVQNLSKLDTISELENILKTLRTQCQGLQSILTDIHKPSSNYIPIGTFCMVDEIFSNIMGSRQNFFLNVSSNSYSINYKIHSNIINDLGKFKESVPKELLPLIIQINFLPIDKNDTLRNSIFAHEIGHVAVGLNTNAKNINSSIYKKLVKKIQSASIPSELSEYKEEVTNWAIERVLPFWVEELICDLIGIHILGPAFFFSMLEIINEDYGASSISESHPPFFLRVRLLCDFIEKSYNKADLESCYNFKCEDARSYYTSSDFPRAYYPDNLRHGFDIILNIFDDTLLDEILTDFNQVDLGIKFTLAENIDTIGEIVNHFNEGVVITESYRSGTAQSINSQLIMNAGWAVKLKNNYKVPKDILNALVDKSLNLSFIKNAWKGLDVRT